MSRKHAMTIATIDDWLRTPEGLREIIAQVFREATPQQLHAIALYAVRVMGKTPRSNRSS